MITSNLCRFMFIVALVLGCFLPVDAAFAAEGDGLARRPPMKPSPMSSVSGRLRPNQSGQDGDAPYVILDRRGTVQYLIRPPAGKNLDPYVNREIRVSGQRIDSDGASPPILEAMKIGPPIGIEAATSPRNARRPDRAVRPVAYQEGPLQPVAEGVTRGEPQFQNSPQAAFPGHNHEFGETSDWDSMDSGAPCGGCNQASCQSCCNQICGPPGQFWVRAEYLYWWTEGMRVPPLVTTGPSAEQPGYLDTPGTTILFGDSLINGFGRSGVRLSSGTWLNACQTVGIAGDYYGLDTATTNYSASSPGDPILSRPFYDLSPTQADPSQIVGQNVEQVASPDSIAGTVSVNAQTRFQSAGLRMLFNLCCSQSCYADECLPSLSGPGGRRVDFLIGYRYARLSDSLLINENLTSLDTSNPGTFLVNDGFTTQNIFNGVELGTALTTYRGQWSLELLSKLALGNSYQTVGITGSTVTTQNDVSTTDVGGLLAQSTNIGQYARNRFAVMPELGANLGYQITPRLRVLLGYTFVYWSSVARPGDQIDLDVNSRLLPNDTRPLAGDTRHPQFTFQDSDFWAQGISTGLDYRW